MINVLIKDGNRSVSWEHFPGESIAHVLRVHRFNPVDGTVAVNLKPCVGLLNHIRLRDCKPEMYRGVERLVITLQSVAEKGSDTT